ncbi:hypothetical protein OIU76_016762 [Salix suchowensis]|nr:hypothetical protein OIU76_016762 [Salix suchowensis]
MPNSNPVKRVQLKVGQASAANLANLLPTGTVLAAQALIPSFTNNGESSLARMTGSTTGLPCGKISGFSMMSITLMEQERKKEINNKEYMAARQITAKDFVHAFTSLTVFLVFALSDSNVQKCFFPKAGANEKTIIMNLPLGAGLLASLLFMLFPTTRRGIGYGDTAPAVKLHQKGEEQARSNKESA